MSFSSNEVFETSEIMVASSKQEEINADIEVLDDLKEGHSNIKINGDSNITNRPINIEEMQEHDVLTRKEIEQDYEVPDGLSNDPMLGAHSDPLYQLMDADFKNMFKVTRSTFENLVEFLSKEEMEPIENIPLYKKLLIVLWLMGTSGSYSEAAEVFNVTEEAAANCFFDVCATLYNQCDNVITWPGFEECEQISNRIETKYGFPGVVGVLGCRYFSISIPKEALCRREHFNAQQKTYCIALQIVCDDNLVIRDIFPGLPGGIMEAQIFRRSPIFEQLTSKTVPRQLVEPSKHILASATYPQLTSLLTPYSNAIDMLSKEKVELNELHDSVRQLVDQTLEMLQDRFTVLKVLDPEVATMVLVVACVIHNFCMVNGDFIEYET